MLFGTSTLVAFSASASTINCLQSGCIGASSDVRNLVPRLILLRQALVPLPGPRRGQRRRRSEDQWQRQRRNGFAKSTRLTTLGNDHIDSNTSGLNCLIDGHHMLNHKTADFMGSRHEFARITKCERDDRRPGRQGNVSGFCIEVWHEVVYGKWLIGELANRHKLLA